MPHFPLDKNSHPDFVSKGKKPTGAVEINRRHYLSSHVVRAFVPQVSAVDLIEGPLTGTSGATISASVADFDGTAGNKYEYADATPVSDEITIVFKVTKRRSSGIWSGGIYSDKDDGNWSSSQGVSVNARKPDSGSSGYLFYVGDETPVTLIDESYVPVNEAHTVVCTWKASDFQKIYVNGSERVSGGAAASFTKSTVNSRIGAYYDESAVRSLDGVIEYLYVFNKSFTQDEVNRFILDPYQILKPSTDLTWFTSAAGGAYTLTADSGSFTLTGTDASLEVGRHLDAGSGSFTFTGSDATLTYSAADPVLSAESGTFTLTGTAATLKHNRKLTADSGTFTFTGTAATLKHGYHLDADSGSFTLTGSDATLTYSPATDFSLSADSGSFALTGSAATLKHNRVLSAASGSFVLSGKNATLTVEALQTPDCFTYLQTTINPYEYVQVTVNADVVNLQTPIDSGVLHLQCTITPVIYVNSRLC